MASGDVVDRDFTEALAKHDYSHRPFERAPTELANGIFLRRARRRIDARTHLRTALDIFEGLKSTRWAERASLELRASGESARRRDPSTITQLTPQEVQIARFVTPGLSKPRHRRSALSQPAHDRLPPPKRVRQARHHPVHGAGPLLPRLGNRSSNQALSPVRANEPAPSLSSSEQTRRRS